MAIADNEDGMVEWVKGIKWCSCRPFKITIIASEAICSIDDAARIRVYILVVGCDSGADRLLMNGYLKCV